MYYVLSAYTQPWHYHGPSTKGSSQANYLYSLSSHNVMSPIYRGSSANFDVSRPRYANWLNGHWHILPPAPQGENYEEYTLITLLAMSIQITTCKMFGSVCCTLCSQSWNLYAHISRNETKSIMKEGAECIYTCTVTVSIKIGPTTLSSIIGRTTY